MDDEFISTIHDAGFEIAIETNGTKMPPVGIDWFCVSPKANADFILKSGHELKIVFPQCGMNPRQHEGLDFNHFFHSANEWPQSGRKYKTLGRFYGQASPVEIESSNT